LLHFDKNQPQLLPADRMFSTAHDTNYANNEDEQNESVITDSFRCNACSLPCYLFIL